MRLIYRLIPKNSGFHESIVFLDTALISRFLRLFLAFTMVYNAKVLVSGYQSIERLCIVLPVKFDVGLFMSVLRNKQLYPIKRGSKIYIFKKGPIFKNISKPAMWNKDTPSGHQKSPDFQIVWGSGLSNYLKYRR
jgi:hypothetical protein